MKAVEGRLVLLHFLHFDLPIGAACLKGGEDSCVYKVVKSLVQLFYWIRVLYR